MTLKNIRLGRAENLDDETRKQFSLPEKGLIIIESRNPDLQENFVSIKRGGIREYLLSLGEFEDIPIEEWFSNIDLMITIIPALEIMKAVTDKNITGIGADIRREAFTLAVELKSLGDIDLLLEGILYDRIKGRIKEDHKVFFESVCKIDNSTKGVMGYNIQESIKWIAKSESKTRKVIILTENVSLYPLLDNNEVLVIRPVDFIYKVRKVLELTNKKGMFSIDEVLLAIFFL